MKNSLPKCQSTELNSVDPLQLRLPFTKYILLGKLNARILAEF